MPFTGPLARTKRFSCLATSSDNKRSPPSFDLAVLFLPLGSNQSRPDNGRTIFFLLEKDFFLDRSPLFFCKLLADEVIALAFLLPRRTLLALFFLSSNVADGIASTPPFYPEGYWSLALEKSAFRSAFSLMGDSSDHPWLFPGSGAPFARIE